MAGQPFKVGRFAHTLRVRLMREHLGIDVDALTEEDIVTNCAPKSEYQQQPGEEATSAETSEVFRHENSHRTVIRGRTLEEERKGFHQKGQDFTHSVVRTSKGKVMTEKRHLNDQTDDDKDETALNDQTIIEESGSSSVQSGSTDSPANGESHESWIENGVLIGTPVNHKSAHRSGNDPARSNADSRADFGSRSSRNPWTVPTTKPKVEPEDFEDPVSDAFWKDIWVASAVHNVSAWPSFIISIVLTRCRRRYTGRFSTPYPTILSPPGSNTENLWHTMSG